MGNMTSLVSSLVSAGSAVNKITQTNRAASTQESQYREQFDYQREQDAAALERQRERDAWERAQAEAERQRAKEAEDRRYQEEQAAREFDAKRRADEQALAYERERQQRLEDDARAAAAAEAARLEEEAKREQERNIFSGSQARDWEAYLKRQNEEFAQREATATTQTSQLDSDAAASEERRRAELRRTMAKARASLGARGLRPDDGSARAILDGQTAETEAESQAAQAATAARRRAIQDDLDNKRRVNLLAQAEFKERQRMDYLNRFFG